MRGGWLALFVVLSVAGPAAADPKEAARAFAEATRAFEAGDYVRAGEAFELAYREGPHYSPLWNAARSWDHAGDEIRAANLYARYLREAPPEAPDRDRATAALVRLSAHLGKVEIHAAEAVRLDGREIDGPIVYVAPGDHQAVAGASQTTFRAVAGESVSVTLAAPEQPPSAPPSVPPPPPAPIVERSGLPPVVAVVGAALAVVGGGLTIASGADTVAKKHAFLDDRTQANLDAGRSAEVRTNVALGLTIGVAAVTGVVALFFTDWRATRAPRVQGAR